MAIAGSKEGEDYTIRQKVLKLFGEAFHIYNASGELVGYCKQKAFRLRESLTFYTDESCRETLFDVNTESVIDFSAGYRVTLPGGAPIGSLRRKGFSSMVRDTWTIHDPDGGQIAAMQEDSAGLAFARRIVPLVDVFSPQVLHIRDGGGRELATFRKHFNLFIHRMGVAIRAEDDRVDDLLLLAAACTYMAIDSRQRQN